MSRSLYFSSTDNVVILSDFEYIIQGMPDKCMFTVVNGSEVRYTATITSEKN